MSARSESTKVSKSVARSVIKRDKCCVVCGNPIIEIHHYVERSRGGMGIKENLVCLCKQHHVEIHNGNQEVKMLVINRLDNLYPTFTDKDRKYDKWRTVNEEAEESELQ